jgi:microcin C transport system substrate-binding protein
VVFSFEAFKKYSPELSANYRHVTKAEKTGDHEVTFTVDAPGNRELPRIVGELTVLPRKWWEDADKDGKKRNISETTLEPPLGSGPYRIKDFSAGRHIVYERVKDHWSRGLNVNIGLNNFDELHYEYFRDTTAALEAFKADVVDWRIENSAKNWATAYDFPAVSDRRVVLEEFAIRNIGMMQAFAFNIRREKFQNPLVRLAFNYVFNFEEMNRQIFFDQYKRIASADDDSTRRSGPPTPAIKENRSTESSAIFSVIGRIRPRRQAEHCPCFGVELPELAARR